MAKADKDNNDIAKLAKAEDEANLAVLIKLRDKSRDDAIRLRAAIAINEMANGKPAAKKEVKHDHKHGMDGSVVGLLAKIRARSGAVAIEEMKRAEPAFTPAGEF